MKCFKIIIMLFDILGQNILFLFCSRFGPSQGVYFFNLVLLELQDFPQQVSKLKQCQYATAQKKSHVASKITWYRKRTKSNVNHRVSPDVTFTALFLTIVYWLVFFSTLLVFGRSLRGHELLTTKKIK